MNNDKGKLKGLISLGLLITVIGFILLFFSVNFGLSLAENWILNRAGGADTSTYLIVIEGSIRKILAIGSILFGIGLATIIVTYYKILNIKV